MGSIEIRGEQKHFGSPFIAAFDEEGAKFPHVTSVLIPKNKFEEGKIPKNIRILIEWEDQE